MDTILSFDLEYLKLQLLERAPGIDVVETLGADFAEQLDLPMAGSYYCGHCGWVTSSSSSDGRCNFFLNF